MQPCVIGDSVLGLKQLHCLQGKNFVSGFVISFSVGPNYAFGCMGGGRPPPPPPLEFTANGICKK